MGCSSACSAPPLATTGSSAEVCTDGRLTGQFLLRVESHPSSGHRVTTTAATDNGRSASNFQSPHPVSSRQWRLLACNAYTRPVKPIPSRLSAGPRGGVGLLLVQVRDAELLGWPGLVMDAQGVASGRTLTRSTRLYWAQLCLRGRPALSWISDCSEP